MKKQILIPLAILATLAIPGIAQAHNATATPSCSGLAWSAVNYDKTVVNSIVVKVDGATVYQDLDFKASDTGTAPWSQIAAHAWSVTVNAPGSQYDKSFSGTWQACQTAPTTTQPAVTTTEPAVTTTTVVVEVGEPPVPTTTASTVANPPVPAVTAPPNPNPVTYECVQDTFGNWIFSGTFIPCQGPPVVAASDVVSLTPVEPVLPVTGGVDWIIIAVAGGIIIVGVFLVRRGRRVQ